MASNHLADLLLVQTVTLSRTRRTLNKVRRARAGTRRALRASLDVIRAKHLAYERERERRLAAEEEARVLRARLIAAPTNLADTYRVHPALLTTPPPDAPRPSA